MKANRAIGRAFPIRKADIGSYRSLRTNGYRPNPMGVTTLSAVNGRGAYGRAHSVRSLDHGLSRAERVERARSLMENRSRSMANVHRASFVRRMKSNTSKTSTSTARKRAGKKLAVFMAARRAGKSKASAHKLAYGPKRKVRTRAKGRTLHARRATRRRMKRNLSRSMSRPQSKAYSAGYAATFGKKKKRKAKAKRRTTTKRKTVKRRSTKRRGTPEQIAARKAKRAAVMQRKKARRAAVSARKKESRAKKAARKAASRARRNTPAARRKRAKARTRAKWPKQVRSTRTKKRSRVAYGPYRRARLLNPRTGRSEYSYLTRSKGRLRRIPEWAKAGADSAADYKTSPEYAAARARIAKRRKTRAAAIERGGDAFTPNSGAKKKMARKRKKKAGSRKRRGTKRKTARKSRRKTTKRTGTRKKPRKAGTKRRRPSKKGTRKRRASKKRSSVKRRRPAKKRRASAKKRRKSSKRGRRVGKRRVRRLKKGLYLVANRRSRRKRRGLSPNRRRRSRKLRTNRRRLRRNGRRYIRNGFKSDFASLMKAGGLILLGFFAHKAVTRLVINLASSSDGATFAGMPTIDAATGKPTFLSTWQKPLVGAPVALAELFLLSKAPGKAESKMAAGGGVVTSWLHSLVSTALLALDQPKALSYLEGYSNSAAYSLRGARGRRGMRGLGVARNAGSIMPRYAPVGQFQQAAAGLRGMGEYFAGQSGMGEYFAGPGVQGVGHYEKAGPLALGPSRSHMGQLPVDDGIRPDSNLDAVMDLAESAAGLGSGYQQAAAGMGQFRQAAAGIRGMGDYYTASPGSGGGFSESTVGTQSQWIPNGPLWAGESNADASYTESELPAGILQTPGGNGVLSG